MKKLLLIAITTFCSLGAYAQANQLNCTEQALTFKISLPAGGHSPSSKIGRFDPAQISTGFRLPIGSTAKQTQPETNVPPGFEKAFGQADAYPSTNIPLPKKMTFPYSKINTVTGKFTCTTYDHFKLLPMPAIGTLTPLLN
ncbi:hypothetical protein SNE26_14820 [Mucilaginibacter sp. cycad4]|uniref:hypothetical protein n=1 Tax=Mucilaginibacter sp. cycad4 TaxID=3342096 RepID=UPI002AAB422C|nr:hypothetical protein [Mucilaginibacter gossypii]WPU97294.1 hypothetical protein SNE26_14820 [Mucilaginibacter gossypii]